VLRRKALDEIGAWRWEDGDRGCAHLAAHADERWSSAYINIPQAGRLGHRAVVGTRGPAHPLGAGMIQILRTDNPLFGPGLNFPQRLCYFNAMAHFLYAVPRLIFLTAPLVCLLLTTPTFPATGRHSGLRAAPT